MVKGSLVNVLSIVIIIHFALLKSDEHHRYTKHAQPKQSEFQKATTVVDSEILYSPFVLGTQKTEVRHNSIENMNDAI